MRGKVLFTLIFLSSLRQPALAQSQEWSAIYKEEGREVRRGGYAVSDRSDNLYILAQRTQGNNEDLLTIKYDALGNFQ